MTSPTPNNAPSNKPYLYFPMEIVEREIAGNLLLAIEALSNDWNCVIGTKKSIFDNAHTLPPGVMFLKSITFGELAMLKRLKSFGHRLVCLDVEGLVYTCIEEFVTVRFCPETMTEVEKLLFWGELQKDAVAKSYPDDAHKFTATGSPIAQLWTDKELHAFYDEEVRALQERFGPYIIIPSSFGTVNHYMGYEATLGIMQRDKMLHEDDEKEFFEFWSAYEAHVLKIFKAFLALLPELSKAFPDHKIIIRPHPSESHETWKEAAKGLDNIEVLFEGTVSPWLLASDAILHWGCTTGLEGYLMGKPAISYNPSTEEERVKFDHKLPQCISVVTDTEEETIKALQHIIKNPDTVEDDYPYVKEGQEILDNWIVSSDEGAAANVISQLNELNVKPAETVKPIKNKISIKEQVWKVLTLLSNIKPLYKLYSEKLKLGVETRAYGRHKTKDIDPSAVENILTKLSEIRNVPDAKAQNIGKNLFLISRK